MPIRLVPLAVLLSACLLAAGRGAYADEAGAMGRIAVESFATIRADPALLAASRAVGSRLFAAHCATCHGADGGGGPGVTSLRIGVWRWGGEPETIAETIRVGINATHSDTRMSSMAPFGPRGLLTQPEAESIVAYVRTLSDPAAARDAPADQIGEGRTLFASDCASCHGADGKGRTMVGGPDLTDAHWTHGGTQAAILASVWEGRKGEMPGFEDRLGPAERKALTLHVLDLR